MGIAVVLAALSLGLILLGLFLLPVIVVRLPEDYFARAPGAERWSDWSLARKARAILRSTLGLGLIAIGIALLVLPGQGLLTILAGVVVAEFPGKIRLERRILALPAVLSALNAIRQRFGKPPFRLEREESQD